MTTLKIEIETVVYDPGTADEETIKEVSCSFVDGSSTIPIIYEYSLSADDYPTNGDVQAYVTSDLASKGIAWDMVEVVEI